MSDLAAHLEDLISEGNENENAASFFPKVKRVALAQGCQREWLADYVETCLLDKALVWYIMLDERTRRNFDGLRLAMLKRFATSVSIPPAAVAAAPITSIPARPPSWSSLRGRLPFVRHDNLFPGYCKDVERMLEMVTDRWECYGTSKKFEALVVELCISSDPSRVSQSLLRIVVSIG
ncbi:hypothetical protein FRB98_001770 [Tulasnella sp. 332]|nr:hypothetical protein FRB98_001770 [Tulasnella sp. 332]